MKNKTWDGRNLTNSEHTKGRSHTAAFSVAKKEEIQRNCGISRNMKRVITRTRNSALHHVIAAIVEGQQRHAVRIHLTILITIPKATKNNHDRGENMCDNIYTNIRPFLELRLWELRRTGSLPDQRQRLRGYPGNVGPKKRNTTASSKNPSGEF